MLTDPLFYLVGLSAVFVMSPIEAAIVVAPLVTFMDVFALNSFGPKTWSKPDLAWLVPGLLVGIALGYLFFSKVDPRFVTLGIALVTIAFTADYFLRGRHQAEGGNPVSPPLALLAGLVSGFTTFVAHAGGPPSQMYLLYRGLNKTLFAGTNLALFTLGNFVKLVPYGLLAWATPRTMLAAAVLAPVVPLGVWFGKWLHNRLEQRRLFFWCYILLLVAAAKMLFDAVTALSG
jgi:uncharacterized membrane protein YfcA